MARPMVFPDLRHDRHSAEYVLQAAPVGQPGERVGERTAVPGVGWPRELLGALGDLAFQRGVHQGVVEGDGELSGDEHDAVEPFGGEGAADEAVLQQQQGPQAPRLKIGTASSEQESRSMKYGSRAKRSSWVASLTTSGSRVRSA